MEETTTNAAFLTPTDARFNEDAAVALRFTTRPNILRCMLNASWPKPRWEPAGGFPPMDAVWENHRAGSFGLRAFQDLTELNLQEETLPPLYFHVLGFPLQFAILTHRAYPIPIWRVKQVRNHWLQHRPLRVGAEVNMTARVVQWRALDKRQEVDIYSRVEDEAGLVWESLNSYYTPTTARGMHAPSPLAAHPTPPGALAQRWRLPSGGGFRFGGLTGDYNGVHWWRVYARLLGSPFTFFHMQRVLGFCLARLPQPNPALPQRLDAWLKGPLPYGREVGLFTEPGDGEGNFALRLVGDSRAAVVGRQRKVPPGTSLLDAHGRPQPL